MTDILLLEKNEKSEEQVARLEPLMRPYRNALNSWEYRSASALICEAFKRYGIALDRYRESESGRPYIVDEQADLSVSHSGRYTCVAITTDPGVSIGIDIEERVRASKRDLAGIAHRFFSPAEAAKVEQSDDTVFEFLKLWTMKEALMKSRRVPLSLVLKGDTTNHKTYFTTGEYVMCIVTVKKTSQGNYVSVRRQ